jgi:nucleotide-binding universal stress UspA family protein
MDDITNVGGGAAKEEPSASAPVAFPPLGAPSPGGSDGLPDVRFTPETKKGLQRAETRKIKKSSTRTLRKSGTRLINFEDLPETLDDGAGAGSDIKDPAVGTSDFLQDDASLWWIDEGYIDLGKVEMKPPERFVVAVDGSDASMAGLNLCCQYWMEKVRTAKLTAVHVYDDTKVLAPKNKKEQIRSNIEGILLSSFSKSRYELSFEKKTTATKDVLMRFIQLYQDPFVVLGFYGVKGKKQDVRLGSTVQAILKRTDSTVIVCHDDDLTPTKNNGAKYVVCVDNNQSSTKAFLDALSLSRERDTIEVVHICGTAPEERHKAKMLQKKYTYMFTSKTLQPMTLGRACVFSLLPKKPGETTAETITAYAEEVGSVFLCVGTVALGSAADGTTGFSNAAAMCTLSHCSVIISHFNKADCAFEIEAKKLKITSTPKAPLKRAKSYRQNRATAERSEEEEGDVKDDSEERRKSFVDHADREIAAMMDASKKPADSSKVQPSQSPRPGLQVRDESNSLKKK